MKKDQVYYNIFLMGIFLKCGKPPVNTNLNIRLFVSEWEIPNFLSRNAGRAVCLAPIQQYLLTHLLQQGPTCVKSLPTPQGQ
jgi:hypothetical protein